MRKSKKLLRSGLAGLLIASLTVGGGTLAYLTDTETADNTFTVGKVKIDLEEPNYPGNDSDEVKAIVPNQTVAKDPQIENTGNNEAIVYLKVEVPQEEYTELGADNVPGEKKLQDLFALKDVSDQWELIRTETTTTEDGKTKTSYIYAYKKPLGKGETTDKLFQEVQMKNSMESDLAGKVEDIIVTAYAIQSTDVSDISLTPAEDGTLGKDVLDQVYAVFLNQSGQETPRPADEGNRSQTGKLGKITYELDGGSLEGALTEYGTADYGYVPPTPTKENYTFTGWSPVSIPSDSTGDVTFTASWKEAPVTLLNGSQINSAFTKLAGQSSNIKSIQKSDAEPSDEIKATATNIAATGVPAYAWYEADTGAIKYWSATDTISLPSNSSGMFSGYSALTDISGLADMDTSNVTNISSMFYNCENLTDISGLSNWNTSNVTNMSDIFGGDYYSVSNAPKITNVTSLANWDTSHVVNMSYVFNRCDSLTDISGLSKWDTSNVTNMSDMFGSCGNLTDISGLSNWITSSVTNMSSMFSGCSSLTNVTALTNWDVSHVVSISNMFGACLDLVDITGLANWDTSNVEDMASLFWVYNGEMSLSDISALSNWNTSKTTRMSGMFQNCPNLTDITALSNWDTSKVEGLDSMFYGCKKLTNINGLSNWDTSNVEYARAMFYQCTNLANINGVANWNTSKVTDMGSMFAECRSITNISSLSNWDTSNVTNMRTMFSSCRYLTSVAGLSNWNTSKVTDMGNMFGICGLTTLNGLSKWDTSKVKDMSLMFQANYDLTDISAIAGWDVSNVTDIESMFSYADLNSATCLNGWNTSNVKNMSRAFAGQDSSFAYPTWYKS